MISIFSVHITVGLVDPQFSSAEFADAMEVLSTEYDVPIGPGIAIVVPRPEPMNDEEEAFQAISPGTHELNVVFDFDPNDQGFQDMLSEDTMWNKYNMANQLMSTVCFDALKLIGSIPTYFDIKISGDYVENSLYEKMKKHRFKR